MKHTKSLILFGLIAFAAVSAFAQDDEIDIDATLEDEAPKHILTDLPPEANDVAVSYVFPEYPESNNFEAGGIIEVVVGFQNNGEGLYNVSAVAASLNSPLMFEMFIQNYTAIEYGIIVEPGQQANVAYRFRPDEKLDPDMDFQLAITLLYNDEEEEKFSTTFFNSTITVFEKTTDFDSEAFFAKIAQYAVFALIALVGYRMVNAPADGGNKKKKIERGTRGEVESDWLSGIGKKGPKKSRKA